jgi:hypothetical protein
MEGLARCVVVALLTGVCAWGIMLEVGILHGWWKVIPTMPFSTALQLMTVTMIVIVVAATLNAAMGD